MNKPPPDPEEESALLHAVLQTVVDAVVTIDQRGVVRNVNPGALHLFGYTREELIGQNVSILMPSPDREQHDSYLSNFLQTGEAKIIGIGREVTAVKKNGEFFPVDLSVTEVIFDHTRLFTGIIRDMSERNRTRNALNRERSFSDSLIQTAHAIVVLLGTQGEIQLINPFLEELSGWKNEEVQGLDWFEKFICPADHDELHLRFEKALAGTPVHGSINNILTSTGEKRIITWSAKRLMDLDGTTLGLLAVGNDITELSQTQKKLIQSERLAAIGQMVTGLAHESRNALQRAQSSLEVLGLDLDDKPHMDQLIQRAQRALSELQQLYEEVRLYAAPLKLDRSPINISELVRDTWDQLKEQWQPAQIQLDMQPVESTLSIRADRLKIQQVIRNVLENAIFVAPELSSIKVVIEFSSLNGLAMCELKITDNGPGLTEEELQSIFEPFFTTKTKGTGLGLAISRRIIEEHNGGITAQNSKSENSLTGATISISLPT